MNSVFRFFNHSHFHTLLRFNNLDSLTVSSALLIVEATRLFILFQVLLVYLFIVHIKLPLLLTLRLY